MKKIIVIIMCLISFNVIAASNDIAAIVNDKPITMYEFSSRKKMMIALNRIDVSSADMDSKLNKEIINILIEEELLNQHSEKVGGTINKEEIDDAIHTIEQKNKMPKGYLLEYMQNLGVSINSFRNQIKGELIKYKIISSLSNSVSVSPKEIDVGFINSGFENFDIDGWMFTSNNEDEITLNKMQKLKTRIKNCKNISDQSFSSFATASKLEGNLKNFETQTKSIILDTKENSASSVFQEDGKFKVALICGKRAAASGEEINKTKMFLSNHKMSQKAAKFFKDLKAKAYVKILLK